MNKTVHFHAKTQSSQGDFFLAFLATWREI
jgi:hypothetical protein